MSELLGKPLPWIDLKDLNEAHLACELLQQGVDALQALTPQVARHEVSQILPRYRLLDELTLIRERSEGPAAAAADLPLFREGCTGRGDR